MASKTLNKSKKLKKPKLCPRLTTVEELSCEVSEIEYVFGLDEVGVACLAGPVVAACYAYPLNCEWAKVEVPVSVKDSKQLNLKQREEAETWLRAQDQVIFAIGEASPKEIDELNIFWATRLAMMRAFDEVRAKVDAIEPVPGKRSVLVDGNQPPKEFKELPENYHMQAIVKGDTKVFPIAAASILAKNYRDKIMQILAKEFPAYGWDSNVGYPTEVHRKALVELGSTLWHRKSFRLDYSEDSQTEFFLGTP